MHPQTRQAVVRDRGSPSGGPWTACRIAPQGASGPFDLRVCAPFAWESVVNRPSLTPELRLPCPPGRRHATPESSCGTPMHASALTKGYGGNPPSGRSVSPPRTGPFFRPVAVRPPSGRGASPEGRRPCLPPGNPTGKPHPPTALANGQGPTGVGFAGKGTAPMEGLTIT
jgi:hypothetical protein